MKATIKFEDGRKAVIKLTPEQVYSAIGLDKITQEEYSVGMSKNGFCVVHGFEKTNNSHTLKKEIHAQLLADRFNLEMEMFRWASEMNDGWVPDWRNNTPKKYGIVWISMRSIIQIEGHNERNEFVFGLAFISVEIARQALEIFGDRILSLYGKQF